MMSKQQSKARLLVLTSTYPRWTGDHEPPFVHELARRLTDQFEVTVLAPHAPGSLRRERLDGVDVVRFRYAPENLERLAYEGGIPHKLRNRPWLGLLVPLFLLAQLLATWQLLRQLCPAAIHAHWLLPQGLVAVMARRVTGSRARLLVTAHGADLHGLRSPLALWLKRRVLLGADAVTVVSRAMAAEASTLANISDRLQVIPMGVDLQTLFTPGPARARGQTLAFAGRLVEKKGVTHLIDAMSILAPRWPKCRLVLAGFGPLRAMLTQQADRLGIAERVEFLGSYQNDELPAILQRSDIAVFPFTRAAGGDEEGLGLVVIEALGCGLPVIATELPAVLDIVRNGETGVLVPPRDAQTLAHAIEMLLLDPTLAERLGHAGRQSALSQFDWTSIVAAYTGILRQGDVVR